MAGAGIQTCSAEDDDDRASSEPTGSVAVDPPHRYDCPPPVRSSGGAVRRSRGGAGTARAGARAGGGDDTACVRRLRKGDHRLTFGALATEPGGALPAHGALLSRLEQMGLRNAPRLVNGRPASVQLGVAAAKRSIHGNAVGAYSTAQLNLRVAT
jgi:hypothetical protein